MQKFPTVAFSVLLAVAATPAPAQERFARIDLPPGFDQRPANFDDPQMPGGDAFTVDRAVARAMTPDRYWNQPGASWGALMQDWYACTVMTAVSRDSRGSYAYVESPSLVSPMERGIGTTIGGYGTTRSDALPRYNRDTCLRVRGWRDVETTPAQASEIRAKSGAIIDDWWKREVGAQQPVGTVLGASPTPFPSDPVLAPNAAIGPNTRIFAERDAQAGRIGANMGILVMAVRRPDAASRRGQAMIALQRYALDVRQLTALMPERRDEADNELSLRSRDRNADYELHAVVVPAGIYVIDGTSVNGDPPVESNCFGAPMIEVPAGAAVYAGDWVPYHDVRLSTGQRGPEALVMTVQIDNARRILAPTAPDLASSLRPAALANGATYMCRNPELEMGRFWLSLAADQADTGAVDFDPAPDDES